MHKYILNVFICLLIVRHLILVSGTRQLCLAQLLYYQVHYRKYSAASYLIQMAVSAKMIDQNHYHSLKVKTI